MKDEILQNKIDLQIARNNAADVEKQYGFARSELDKIIAIAEQKWNDDNAELLTEKAFTESKVADLDTQLRARAILYYQETGEKQFDIEVSVRVTKSPEYDDKTALDWAVKHEMCLALDKTAFKKVAAASPLDFVTVTETVSGVLAKEFKL